MPKGSDNVIYLVRRVAANALDCQSIGFNATISRSTEGDTNGFVPFFTPNRKASTNILELVEPADIVKYGFVDAFQEFDKMILMQHSKQIHPGVHLEVTDDHLSRTADAIRLVAYPYGRARFPSVTIHSALWLLRSRDTLHDFGTKGNMQASRRAWRRCSSSARDNGSLNSSLATTKDLYIDEGD